MRRSNCILLVLAAALAAAGVRADDAEIVMLTGKGDARETADHATLAVSDLILGA